ncbi:MAG: hypothetical protein JST55_09920 [Bacteroidetes bacterium]|nr:hypothetical protein [Bacteroidota bacterium]
MQKMYGPFYCSKNVWHWHKDCPDFPQGESPEAMVSTVFPETYELCPKCMAMNEKEVTTQISAVK